MKIIHKYLPYTILFIILLALTYLIIKAEAISSKELENAIQNKQPLSCGDPLRDVPYILVSNYTANHNIIDNKTNKIWSKRNCNSYYITR